VKEIYERKKERKKLTNSLARRLVDPNLRIQLTLTRRS
jgi:hypothetical protein